MILQVGNTQAKMGYPPTREEYNELRNKLKLFEQNNKQNKNDDTTHKTMKEKKKASTFTNVDVELHSIPKDNRKNTPRRNSWAEYIIIIRYGVKV